MGRSRNCLFNNKRTFCYLFCEFDVSEEISNKHRIANRALITLSFNSTNILPNMSSLFGAAFCVEFNLQH